MNELGYVLDHSAGTLSSRRTGFIAALVPSINNSNFSDTARGITEELQRAGLQLMLGYTDYSEQKEEELIETMLRRRPEGIILTGGVHTERARRMLKMAAIPVVETWDLPADPIDQVVGFSNEEAMALLTRTLAGRGYRRFGFIGGTSARDQRGDQRRRGFIRALDELGLPPRPTGVIRRSANIHRAGRPGDCNDAGALAGHGSRHLRFRSVRVRRPHGVQAPWPGRARRYRNRRLWRLRGRSIFLSAGSPPSMSIATASASRPRRGCVRNPWRQGDLPPPGNRALRPSALSSAKAPECSIRSEKSLDSVIDNINTA